VRNGAILLFVSAQLLAGADVHVHGRFEATFTASMEYNRPLHQVTLLAQFRGPGGAVVETLGFWDGGRTWKVRFSPDRAGQWSYITSASNTSDRGLHGQTGSFRAVAYRGSNPLYQRGAPRVSADRRYFVHADGTPWFWLACTGWNSALLSTDEEWTRYLNDRVSKRYTAIQFILEAPWRAAFQDELGQTAFSGVHDIQVHPEFFQRMDRRVGEMADKGLAGVAVLLWALTSAEKESPGEVLPESEAIRLASYMVARYTAYPMLWFLGGDGDYRGEKAERWRKIGRAVFPEGRFRRPVSLHPRGLQDPWAELKDEYWIDFFNYQTGHGGDERKWQWNATGGTASGWKLEPARPVVDSEPNYEGHMSYHGQKIGDAEVRKAAYYSLLAAPPAGITYGAHGIWPWIRKPEVPLNHARSGVADPWFECLDYPGSKQMTFLRRVFEMVEWWKLRPDRSLLVNDPDPPDYFNWPMPAFSTDRRAGLIYLPKMWTAAVDLSRFDRTVTATWYNPRTGETTGAGRHRPSKGVAFTPPGEGDWLLVLRQ
jgi:hypothetical protein